MPIIIPANSAVAGGYDVPNAVRFNTQSSTEYMQRNMSSVGNMQAWTVSVWVKRAVISSGQHMIFAAYSNASNSTECFFEGNDTLNFRDNEGGSFQFQKKTTMKFEDPSAWYHLVFSSSAGAQKIYVNGVEVTSFSPNTNGSGTSTWNNDKSHSIGANVNGGSDKAGLYMAEFTSIDGQTLTPTSFGEFDEDSGIWVPKDVTDLTFGTNGFYLPFSNSGALGEDFSGNNLDFTVNNMDAQNQVTDTCTNNFAVANPNDNFYANAVFAEGNIQVTTNASAEAMTTGTISLSGGRWYYEVDVTAIGTSGTAELGFTPHGSRVMSGISGKAGNVTPFAQAYKNDGKVETGNGSGGQTTLATLSTYAAGNIIGVYLDLVDFKSYWSKDGVLQNSGTGLNITALNANSHDTSGGTGVYIPFVGDYNSGGAAVFEFNFGNPFQSQSSSVTDDNGFGKFEYSPNITGDGTAKSFFAICTKNLAETGG